MKKLSYSSSGVSINKGNKFVSEIKIGLIILVPSARLELALPKGQGF